MAAKNTINLLFDDTFTFTLLEDDNITPISLSSIADVIILFKVNETEVLKFKSTVGVGYKQWAQDVTNDNKLHCKIDRSDSKNFPEGKFIIELIIVEYDSSYSNNQKYKHPIEIELGVLKNTKTKEIIS